MGNPVYGADPNGTAGTDIHRDRTYEWRRQLRITHRVARAIAVINLDVDADRGAFPNHRYHMNDWLLGDERRQSIADRLASARGLAHNASLCEGTRKALVCREIGAALHAVQDIVAHGNRISHPRWLDDMTYGWDGRPNARRPREIAEKRATRRILLDLMRDALMRRLLTR
jgi:hypothetical protein